MGAIEDHFWLDVDMRLGQLAVARSYRTCPTCFLVGKDISVVGELEAAVWECPRCQTLSVCDTRRYFWPRRSLRRKIPR